MIFPLTNFNPFRIGLHPIDKQDWLFLNVSDSAYIKNKYQLAQERLNEVFFVAENNKQDIFELASKLQSELLIQEPKLSDRLKLAMQKMNFNLIGQDNPLLALSFMIEDDLIILQQENGFFRMVAGAIFSPSGWLLKDKQLLDIDAIHSRVPHYDSLLADRLKTMLLKLPTEKPFERHNWSLYKSSNLYQPPLIKNAHHINISSDADIQSLHVRVERQTLYKPKDSALIVFSIKVINYPISELTTNKTLLNNFYLALEELSADMIEYKGLTSCIGFFKKYLKSFL
ncbi:MAG: heme-dependent oxidative N-demethylase subunit alpha family protein [Gammaproteobacteria bacterium]